MVIACINLQGIRLNKHLPAKTGRERWLSTTDPPLWLGALFQAITLCNNTVGEPNQLLFSLYVPPLPGLLGEFSISNKLDLFRTTYWVLGCYFSTFFLLRVQCRESTVSVGEYVGQKICGGFIQKTMETGCVSMHHPGSLSLVLVISKGFSDQASFLGLLPCIGC